MRMLKCIYFKQVHLLTHAAYHFNSSVQRVLISNRCHVRFATLVEIKKKCGVRDDINYTCTSLKIVRLGIARTHGWVELSPMVPMSLSHRSSTVLIKKFVCLPYLKFSDLFPETHLFSIWPYCTLSSLCIVSCVTLLPMSD